MKWDLSIYLEIYGDNLGVNDEKSDENTDETSIKKWLAIHRLLTKMADKDGYLR